MRVSLIVVWAALLSACSNAPKGPGTVAPLAAHLIPSDGTPVPGAPEPEVVRLIKIEDTRLEKHVTVGNSVGDYVLVCNLEVNDEKHAIKSCLSPQPHKYYLLFRENTKWRVAQDPLTLEFFEDFSVSYNNAENIALMLAKRESGEEYGVYWLRSWTAKPSAH